MTLLRWSEMTWPDVAALDRERAVPVVPTGAVEAHGPHLPLGTDVVIAEAMVSAAGAELDAHAVDLVVLPAFHYTAAGFARSFAGTISVRRKLVADLLVDLGLSLHDHGFRYLAFANAHFDPDHLWVLYRAAERLSEATHLTVIFPDVTRKPWALRLSDEFKSGACHAGRYEGSIVMAARGELVREAARKALAPNPVSLSTAIREGETSFLGAGGPEAYFGDPAAATVEEGRATIATLGRILAEAVLAAVG